MIGLADQAEFGKLQDCRDEKTECFGVLRLGNQKERPQIDRQSFQYLGAPEPKKAEIHKREGSEDAAIERIVGVIACPVVRLAVFEEFQRYRLQVFGRSLLMKHKSLEKVLQNEKCKVQIHGEKSKAQRAEGRE